MEIKRAENIVEKFEAKEVGDKFLVVSTMAFNHEPEVILENYRKQEEKLQSLEAEIAAMPKHKSDVENEMSVLKMRMDVLKPHLARAKELVEKKKRTPANGEQQESATAAK